MPEEKVETPEERKQRKLAEVAKKLDQVRAQHEAWEASGLQHQAFKTYEEFREPISKDEQLLLDGYMENEQELLKNPPPPDMVWEKGFIDGDFRLALSPKLAGYMRIAMDRAEAQTGTSPYPEESGLMEKYPGIDPRGKYTEAEMGFAFRLEQVKAAMAVRPPEVQSYVKDVLDDMGKTSTAIGSLMNKMAGRGADIRLLTRASKVALDQGTSEHLEEEAFNMLRNCKEMQWADRTIQTLESLVGLSDKPITDLQREEMKKNGREIPKKAEALREAPSVPPASLTVEFADFEHERQYRFLADPNHWGQSLRSMPPDFTPRKGKEKVVDGIVSRYASATASRTLEGCFHQIESLTRVNGSRNDPPGINRGDLITVDGMTVREHMERQYLAEHKTLSNFGNFYKKNYLKQAGEIVSAGLMAGKRVEAFIPDKMGRIPKEPVQVTKTGYEPSPLKKVTLNAWERHFAKHGFYKQKLARAEEYRRVMESRERVKAINDKQRAELQISNSDFMRNQIFGGRYVSDQALDDSKTQYSWSRGFPTTLAVSVLAARGHSFEDITNPDKLREEKLAVGREVIEHTKDDDHAWIGRMMHDGYKALIDETDQLYSTFDITDPRQIQEHYVEVAGRTSVLFDLYQEVTRPGAVEGFMARAEEIAPGSSPQQEFEMEERIRALGTLRLGMDNILEGKLYYSDSVRIQQAELADNALQDSTISNYFAGVVTIQRFAKNMQGNVPASRALGGMEAAGLLTGAGMTPELTHVMEPVWKIKDSAQRGQMYRALQHLATHDRLNQALPTALERHQNLVSMERFALGEDGKIVKNPQKVDIGDYRLQIDRKTFAQTLQAGAKKLESARKLEEQHRENTAEAEAKAEAEDKQEKEAAKQQKKAAKQEKKAAVAKPGGRVR